MVTGTAERANEYGGMTLLLVTEPPPKAQAVALGAGGRIAQRIEPDTSNNPRMWDVDSSRLLGIQLLDARTFRQVTGLPAPETPVTAETYAALGLPFFQLMGKDGKKMGGKGSGGVAGEWSGLMGVNEAVGKAAGLADPKKKGKWKGKEKEKRRVLEPAEEDSGVESVEEGEWGLLKTGAWGRVDLYGGTKTDSPGDNNEVEGDGEQYGERRFDHPIVLLDVDDTVPKFESVVKDEDFYGLDAEEAEDLYDWG